MDKAGMDLLKYLNSFPIIGIEKTLFRHRHAAYQTVYEPHLNFCVIISWL